MASEGRSSALLAKLAQKLEAAKKTRVGDKRAAGSGESSTDFAITAQPQPELKPALFQRPDNIPPDAPIGFLKDSS